MDRLVGPLGSIVAPHGSTKMAAVITVFSFFFFLKKKEHFFNNKNVAGSCF